jgi:hypothetical protein
MSILSSSKYLVDFGVLIGRQAFFGCVVRATNIFRILVFFRAVFSRAYLAASETINLAEKHNQPIKKTFDHGG